MEQQLLESPKKPVTVAVIGAGNRGKGYAEFGLYFPSYMKVVAVADPDNIKRETLRKAHHIESENVFSDWRELAAKGKRLCNAVMICTPDREHTAPAIAFADLKYNILLEKPLSVTVEECLKIYEAVVRNDIIFALAHVLRYTAYNKRLKSILDSKVLGDIVNIQHLEPVGYWHFAHSFVRGNWHNERESSFSLLAKSCHDIDLIRHMMGSSCTSVSSFGSLKHFRKENKPREAAGATSCFECPLRKSCPYSAERIYIDAFNKRSCENKAKWPIEVVHPDVETLNVETLRKSLLRSNYGRCVYDMDNDVCDNQVVNMQFENGSTCSFTMIAFSQEICTRKTKIFGTKGQLEGDGLDEIKVHDFVRDKYQVINTSEQANKEPSSGHGGGDFGLMRAFVMACATGDAKYLSCSLEEFIDSYMNVFAAEESRLQNTVIDLKDFKKKHNLLR